MMLWKYRSKFMKRENIEFKWYKINMMARILGINKYQVCRQVVLASTKETI